MSTSSAIPDDLQTYADACTALDQQLLAFAQGTLSTALREYAASWSSFARTSASGPGILHGADGYTHGYGTTFPVQTDLAQYATRASDIDTWVGNVGMGFANADSGGADADYSSATERESLVRRMQTLQTVNDSLIQAFLDFDPAAALAAYQQQLQQTASYNSGQHAAAQLKADVANDGQLSDADLGLLQANMTDSYFAAGLLNNLDQATLQALDGTLQSQSFDANDANAAGALVAHAYESGLVQSWVTQQLFSDLVTNSGDTGASDAALMPQLSALPNASSIFLSQLSVDQINTWNNNDNGGSGVFSQVAVSVVNANWDAFANPSLHNGALTPGQFAAAMTAATQTDQGKQALTDAMGAWFIAHAGAPSGDPTSVRAWVAQLVNMNGAIASPTGAHLQSALDWIEGLRRAAEVVGTAGASMLGGELLFGGLSTAATEAVGASTFADAWDAGLTFESSFGAASTAADDTTALVTQAEKLYQATTELRDDSADIQKAIDAMDATDGVKGEISYYLVIIHNTYSEAVTRLLQEGLIVDAHGNRVSASLESTVAKDATSYYIESPQTPGSYDIQQSTPVSVVWAQVLSQFTATH